MSVETKDYVKVGQMTYRAGGFRWVADRSDFVTVVEGEFKTLSEAQSLGTRWATAGAEQINIERGTYEADVWEDEEHGMIYDALWQADDNWIVHGWPHEDGSIEWEEESW